MINYPPNINVLNLLAQMPELPISDDLASTLLSIGKAILILIIGIIVANIFKGIVKKALHQTDIDNRLAAFIAGDSRDNASQFQTEKWISEIVGWIIILFVIVAFLNALDLEVVSQPLNTFLNEVMAFLPSLGGAILLLVLAWGIATIVKLFATKTLNKFHLDERLNQQIQEDEEDEEILGEKPAQQENLAIGDTIGNALYWFIYLLFLPSILGVLQLDGTLRPLEELVNDILGILPNVFAAIIIGFIGWIVAQVVKKVVTNLLKASGANAVGARFGLSTTQKNQSLAYIIGSIVYVLILIPVAITALDALQIQAISVPAIAMLNQVLELLPKLFAAIVVIGLAYFAGQYLAELFTNLLANIGFNNVFIWLGITETQQDEFVEVSPTQPSNTKTPAEIVGGILLVGIMLIATLTAVDILQIEALKDTVAFISLLAGQVLVGVVILAIGIYFANLVFKLVANSGTRQAEFLAQVARISIMVLVIAMALERIGIAPNIVNLAFGLLTGGIAVAIALAFGLGGREAAGNALQRWLDSFRSN